MASVSSVKKTEGGKISCITIEVVSNGFEVRVERVPAMGKNGPQWEPSAPKDKMVFTSAEDMTEYIENLVGAKEEPGEAAEEAPVKKA